MRVSLGVTKDISITSVRTAANGWSVVELLVVLGVVTVLTALVLPALLETRETASDTLCTDRLRQFGIALQSYHDAHDVFPPGAVYQTAKRPGTVPEGDELRDGRAPWTVLILPFLGEQPRYERFDLETACRNTVASARRERGLKSRVSKKFKPTTTVVDPAKRPAGNVLDQGFSADAPNRKWVTDITDLPTQGGWVYLAVVLDLFSRKVVGWSMADSLATTLVSTALKNAIESRRPETRQLLHHSDRGCQYTSDLYQTTLRTLGITGSMSRTECCDDNAVMERFFWSLKHEWTKHEEYADLEEARLRVFRDIETFDNSERLHQTLNDQSPSQFESNHARQLAG